MMHLIKEPSILLENRPSRLKSADGATSYHAKARQRYHSKTLHTEPNESHTFTQERTPTRDGKVSFIVEG